MIGQSRAFLRYLTGLSGYLRHPLSLADAPHVLRAQQARRDRSFLHIVERGIYENPGSPYLRLLEHASLPVVRLLVSPSVGPVDADSILQRVLRALEETPGGRSMADQWRQGEVLQVSRQEPYVTSSAKILPLHIVRPAQREIPGSEGPSMAASNDTP